MTPIRLDPKLHRELNDILRLELGSAPDGSGLYAWEYSEDLFWPAYSTGKMVENVRPSGIITLGNEYKRDRMTHKYRDQWLVTKWIPPDQLSDWKRDFPGADYPANGYRIFTNAALPVGQIPTHWFTKLFTNSVKHQREMTPAQLYMEWKNQEDHEDFLKKGRMEDMIGNDFTAFLNPTPGARGGHVSTQAGIGESPVLRPKTANTEAVN